MNFLDLWHSIKPYLSNSVTYILPIVAIIFSIWAFADSRKSNKINNRVAILEEQLKKYELEAIEKERKEATEACIEARLYNVSKSNYKLKIWNSGKATAYNIDFTIPKECESMVWKDKTPYEVLEANKSYEESAVLYLNSLRKFTVTTSWQDNQGKTYSKEQIVSV